MKNREISTDNEGILEKIEPFKSIRGLGNEGVKMGQAKNKDGEVFDIYPASCGLPNCFCWSTAKKVFTKNNLKMNTEEVLQSADELVYSYEDSHKNSGEDTDHTKRCLRAFDIIRDFYQDNK